MFFYTKFEHIHENPLNSSKENQGLQYTHKKESLENKS